MTTLRRYQSIHNILLAFSFVMAAMVASVIIGDQLQVERYVAFTVTMLSVLGLLLIVRRWQKTANHEQKLQE